MGPLDRNFQAKTGARSNIRGPTEDNAGFISQLCNVSAFHIRLIQEL
jgi:hypothetical protein